MLSAQQTVLISDNIPRHKKKGGNIKKNSQLFMQIIWSNAAFISIKEYFSSSTPNRSAMAYKDNIDGRFESENFKANILGFSNTLLSYDSNLMPNGWC